MGRGTHRGFITYEELNKSLGKRNLSDDNLAQAFIHILDEKISRSKTFVQPRKNCLKSDITASLGKLREHKKKPYHQLQKSRNPGKPRQKRKPFDRKSRFNHSGVRTPGERETAALLSSNVGGAQVGPWAVTCLHPK